MKYVIIVLLVAALGAGAYYYFSKKQTSSSLNSKELIIGKWKIDSLIMPKDDTLSDLERTGIFFGTGYRDFNYQFDSAGLVLRKLPGSIKTDTSFYRWVKDDQLTWTLVKNDTITNPLQVVKLNKDDLILQYFDEEKIYFKKEK